jgi:2-(1,2-epoxy-1,2-dihydrophenyl)acetyl-CoA isomerase
MSTIQPMALATLQYSHQNSIATITFNRPKSMNSLNDVMAKELLMVFEAIHNDEAIRVVILQGAESTFMAGGDVSFFYQHLNDMASKAKQVITEVHQVVRKIQNSDKIFLASVHGVVAGIGVSFMLACDLVIAADSSKFTLAYSKIGVTPDGSVTYTLPRVVGTKKAMELALLSDVINANTALALGMINWIADENELVEQTLKIANRIAAGPRSAFATTKRLINQSWQHTLEQQFDAEEAAFVAASQTEDFRRGVTAFITKSKVKFSD